MVVSGVDKDNGPKKGIMVKDSRPETGIQKIDSQDKADKPHMVLYHCSVTTDKAFQDSNYVRWYVFDSEECYKLSMKFKTWQVDVNNSDEKILKKNKVIVKKVPIVAFYDRFGKLLFTTVKWRMKPDEMEKLLEKALKLDEKSNDNYQSTIKKAEEMVKEAKTLLESKEETKGLKLLEQVAKMDICEENVYKEAIEIIKKVYLEAAQKAEKEGDKRTAMKNLAKYRDYCKDEEYDQVGEKIKNFK
jgi:hypothetical protein